MSLARLAVVFVLVCVVVSIVVVMAMRQLSKRQKISEEQKFQEYNKRFRFYYDFALTRQLFRKIYKQIGGLAVYNMLEVRLQTVKFYEKSLSAALALFVIGTIGLGDIVSGIVLLMFAYVMIDVTISKRIDNVNYQTLGCMAKYLRSVRECYTRVRNVPDALNDAEVDPLLQKQAADVYLICTANDAEQKLNDFYKECPNRIMRTFATTCYIQADSGEDSAEGFSPFKQAIGLILDEVDMEQRRQFNQKLQFATLDKLPFVPLFMYPPIKIFYTHILSATSSVFDSMIGYVIKLVVVVACFISYYILANINNASIARTDDRLQSITKLMYRDKVVKFARTLVPRSFKKRLKLQQEIDGCLSSKDLNYFSLEKLVYASAFFFISIVFSILILLYARNAVYNGLSSMTMSVTLKYTAEQEMQTLDYDHSVLKMEELPSDEEIVDTFRVIFPKYTTMELEAQRDRLKAKYSNYRNLNFKWYFAFIYIAMALIGWRVPNLLLSLRVKMVKSEAEMDVLQLQTIISILMDTPLDTQDVLFWLSKSSDIHKDIISYCYHEYVRHPEYALNHLKAKSSSAEFTAMCDKLLTTVYQVTLKEAFEDLIGEREHTLKLREAAEMAALKSKRNIAGPIATAPMIVWMVAVFILPLGIVAVRSAISMMGQLDI